MESRKNYLPLLLVLFAASGTAALIYEIVWLQLLQLVIGSSAVSLAVLLGTWMGGMCLGSLLFARFVGPGQGALKVYAVLEAATAVSESWCCSACRWWNGSISRAFRTGCPA